MDRLMGAVNHAGGRANMQIADCLMLAATVDA